MKKENIIRDQENVEVVEIRNQIPVKFFLGIISMT